MENNNDWLAQRLEELSFSSTDYKRRAFFKSMYLNALQQHKRIEQAQNELDGRLWNPSRW
ncbi:hypothetical protein [Liquorilactobacillus uvarum]|uniref:Uncharacterized protein n=1 Tax=Liquorilactobacillus uvarum DSM 19971 TaxID=1423812 RepID=A0A0R1Q4S6_9LACO|nr:hypothetical protein [Liquorilactobacillus uvarum]KRL37301.1 hypothetical protein FD20_GL000482 [Liquorilactobacillus uvarum DSM 19971]